MMQESSLTTTKLSQKQTTKINHPQGEREIKSEYKKYLNIIKM